MTVVQVFASGIVKCPTYVQYKESEAKNTDFFPHKTDLCKKFAGLSEEPKNMTNTSFVRQNWAQKFCQKKVGFLVPDCRIQLFSKKSSRFSETSFI